MRIRIVLSMLFIVVLVSGCASQIMQGYVGQTVADVISDYGVPATAFDMPDGTRAFVWQMNNAVTYGGSSYTTGTYSGNTSAYAVGSYGYANTVGNIYSQTYTTPSYTSMSSCAYVLYANKVAELNSPAAWRVVGFKKPRLDCE